MKTWKTEKMDYEPVDLALLIKKTRPDAQKALGTDGVFVLNAENFVEPENKYSIVLTWADK